MQKNKLIYFGLVLFLISVVVGGILWFLGSSLTYEKRLSLDWLFIGIPIATILSAILGVVVIIFGVSFGVVLKNQDRLLRKIFLTAVFFLAIFFLGQGLVSVALPGISLLFEDISLKDFCAEFGQLYCLGRWIMEIFGWAGIIGFLLLITGLILSFVKFIKKKKAPKSPETNTSSES